MRNLWSKKNNKDSSSKFPLYFMHAKKSCIKKKVRKKANRRRNTNKTALPKEIEYNITILMIINVAILVTVLLFI